MIALLQRVTEASVTVNHKKIAQIQQGLLVLLGVEKTDTKDTAKRLVERTINYRIFADEQDRMNLSLKMINGGLLIVPQFTLPADTRKGSRPSFTPAAPPNLGLELFEFFCATAQLQLTNVEHGQFAADMQVALINDGPATFWLQVN